MVKKALTIGINYTSLSYCALNGCIDDIENITEMLVKHYGYANDNIIQLRDDINNPVFQPTRYNILHYLNELINQSDKLTEIWIHYSGHGSQIKDKTGEELDGMDDIIVPIDYKTNGFIVDNEIYNIIKNSKCKTMLIFDCCHSGSVCDLQWSFEYNGTSEMTKTLNVNKHIYNPYVICLAGCKDSQTSADIYSNELKEPAGAFTDALIHCLKINNHQVSVLKLYANICTYLVSEGYSQKPILSCSSSSPYYNLEPTTAELELTKKPTPYIFVPTTVNTIVNPPAASPAPQPQIRYSLKQNPKIIKMGLTFSRN